MCTDVPPICSHSGTRALECPKLDVAVSFPWPGNRNRQPQAVTLKPKPTSREYEVVLTPEDEGGFCVAVPALPGCTSQGETREEALPMIREAIEFYIESLVVHGDPIPGPIEIERVTVTA